MAPMALMMIITTITVTVMKRLASIMAVVILVFQMKVRTGWETKRIGLQVVKANDYLCCSISSIYIYIYIYS